MAEFGWPTGRAVAGEAYFFVGTAEIDGNSGNRRKQMETDGNRRFLLERITTDRNGYERICSVVTTTIVAERRDAIS